MVRALRREVPGRARDIRNPREANTMTTVVRNGAIVTADRTYQTVALIESGKPVERFA